VDTTFILHQLALLAAPDHHLNIFSSMMPEVPLTDFGQRPLSSEVSQILMHLTHQGPSFLRPWYEQPLEIELLLLPAVVDHSLPGLLALLKFHSIRQHTVLQQFQTDCIFLDVNALHTYFLILLIRFSRTQFMVPKLC